LGRIESAFLVAGIVSFTVFHVFAAKKGEPEVARQEPAPGAEPIDPGRHWILDALFIVGGLFLLVVGSRLLVDHSVALAQAFGVSQAIIGLTIVASGTSMPELATSLLAAVRKQPDIAIGNVVGSNIFNILAILGISGLCSPLHAPGVALLDFAVMIAFSLLLVPLLYTGRRLHRLEGVALLVGYGVYLLVLWPS
jgi:cation:H+ antiporter